MARLQDFSTVTPTSSDKLLVVQSQGQGLVPYGSKLDSANPTGTGSLSLNRRTGSAEGTNSVAVGQNCIASGIASHAEGINSQATGNYSHAEGGGAIASGTYSHAEGGSTASGSLSHAEGDYCEASGSHSHAEGYHSTTSGTYSHAEGSYTIANRKSHHVFGEYNAEDTGGANTGVRGTYVEIVGNGTAENARSNARTLDWSGNETLAGDLTINGNQSVTTSLSNKLDKANFACGKELNLSAPANSYADFTINFGKTFANPPIVTANVLGPFTPTTEITGPSIKTIGTSSFDVRVKSNYSSSLNIGITWIAIEA